ncbi:hypothetical protein A1OQ_14855 [Enterovibrio norvegicus FF-162]|uniref:ATPase n=1 Tax=Enterovibrio norvegicus FF-454 TaxID=1185651 RepID=A0A1E5BWV5_9GAMM|nr:hypothetical protein [Enterovibrio norvegicus]OEE57748.1 hypothetical protein A1OK_16725 [Enterovibrio norvegicus FF-454]OEE87576.1 hypothetical protein A1OQ_14855 [Enterovibrio norvegicus FF-162]
MKNLRLSALAVVLVSSITACQSTSEPAQIASETNGVSQQSQNTLQIYEKAKSDYARWLAKMEESKELRLYSKDAVEDLFDAWEDAVDVYEDFDSNPAKATESYSVFSSGTYAQTFDKRMVKVATLHAELLTLKETADSLLAEAIAEMAYLDMINAEAVFASRYSRIARDYRALFEYVADNDLDDAQVKQVQFLDKAKALEVAVALQINVVPLNNELVLLRREGFKSVAPISYTKAGATLEQAEAVVTADPRDISAIEKAVLAVKFEIGHLKHIGLEVKRFRNIDDGKFEPLILDLENQLHRIAQAFEKIDLRDKPIKQQTDALASKAEALAQTLNNTADVDPELKQLMAKLESVNTNLSLAEQDKETLSAQVTTLEAKKASDESLIDDLRMVIDTIKPKDANAAAASDPVSAPSNGTDTSSTEKPKV